MERLGSNQFDLAKQMGIVEELGIEVKGPVDRVRL